MDGLSLSAEVEQVVRLCGVTVVDELPDYVKSHPLVLRSYVFSPTYLGVLRALERQCANDGQHIIIGSIMFTYSSDVTRIVRAALQLRVKIL